MASREIKHEFRDRILPPDHPLSIHVRRVTSRILKHSNLGHVRGETSPLAIDEPLFGSTWTLEDPYTATIRETHGPEKEWDVVVVHDKSIINASASPGWYKWSLTPCRTLIRTWRSHYGIHRDITYMSGRTRPRCCAGTWSFIFFVEYPTIHWSKRYRNWPRSRPSHRRKAIFTNNKIYPAHGLAISLWSGLPHWKYASYIPPRTSKFPHTRNRRWLFQLFSLSSRVMVPLSADLIGLRLMSRACYDPRAAPEWVILFV